MENHMNFNMFERRPLINSRAPSVKWFKEWVPQDVVATGGKCKLLKWVNEGTLKALKEKKEPEVPEPEPEPATEIIFLCSYEGCGKPFIDASALRKHAHIHGERHHICHYENCGKKFLDSSKLKRHYLIHTGERDFVCPHEGCGKAFSLDFNLRSHMKTHSQENYHICPYPDCGKRYAHEYKLKNHISSHHEKQNNIIEVPKYIQPVEKPQKTPRSAAATYASTSTTDRPYTCPYEGCNKAYIHEYKLNLHLRREHPGHFKEDNTKNAQHNTAAADHDMNEGSDQDVFGGSNKRSNDKKLRRPKPKIKLPPVKVAQRRGSTTVSPANNVNAMKKQWQVNEEAYDEEEEDSEETEEERDNIMEGWRYAEQDEEEDDEETEYED